MNIIGPFYFLLIASAILFIFTDEISASDCSDPSDQFTQTRPMPGGISKTSQSSPETIQAAKQLQNEINQSSSLKCQVQLTKILNASTQVVAGEIIRLQVELCPLGDGCDTNHCKICSAKIFKDLKGGSSIQCFECNE